MNAEQIAKLKELALAAVAHSENIGEEEWYCELDLLNGINAKPDMAFICGVSPEALLEFSEHYERVNASAKKYGETLQCIGNAIGLLAGDDLMTMILPRVAQLIEAERTSAPVSVMSDEKIEEAAWVHIDPKRQLDWTIPENQGATAIQRAYFRAGMRAGLAAAPQAHAMRPPEGWKLTRCEDGAIIVSKNSIGGYAAWKDDSNIASSILYHFADEVLASAPLPPDTVGGEARDAALEDAAQTIENEACTCCWPEEVQEFVSHIAETIRKLKAKPNADCSIGSVKP